MRETDLKDVSTHFAFGENWAQFATSVGQEQIESAIDGLRRLLGPALAGRTFLDIGSGSGIHSLAALRLGATKVLATDIDLESVRATEMTLNRFASQCEWTAIQRSVFSLDPESVGRFDVVYAWGVLHHTGSMYEAIERAAAMVAEGGLFCVALYQRTPLCGFWKVEKRFYSRRSPRIQRLLRGVFVLLQNLYWRTINLRHLNTDTRSAPATLERGMSLSNDVHDWLGGYPYESIAPSRAHEFVQGLGFRLVSEFIRQPGVGLFGTGCDEYVFRRISGP
jgi:2-polyprenyl-6-hydroxyphenyl methylase/3-demethylubiquinone-9 3-methyltransferase